MFERVSHQCKQVQTQMQRLVFTHMYVIRVYIYIYDIYMFVHVHIFIYKYISVNFFHNSSRHNYSNEFKLRMFTNACKFDNATTVKKLCTMRWQRLVGSLN